MAFSILRDVIKDLRMYRGLDWIIISLLSDDLFLDAMEVLSSASIGSVSNV